ncbi:MFS general substrate transporter [Lichtheimia hyalospora FSU 10163]|nr:MFS general substrate transporter [Lichtheimia hyalospora FSU 10163]
MSESKTTMKNEKSHHVKQSRLRYFIGDPYSSDDPQQLTMRRKQAIITVVALSALTGPLGSMIYMPALLAVADDLHTSSEAVNGTVSAYVVFMGIAPLIWATLSDFYGRKRMYLSSIIIGIVASIICAFSVNIAMLIVFRAIQAAGLCASQTLGAGVIADTIPMKQRGRAYGFFYIGPLLGPVIGPTIGGVLSQYYGWQSSFYFLAVLGGLLFILVAIFLPETLRKDKSQTDQQRSPNYVRNVLRAFIPLLVMLRDPSVLVVTIYSTVIFGCLFFLNPTITDTFQRLYGYNQWQVGLVYLAFGAGLCIGSILAGQVSDWVLQHLRRKNNGQVVPEMRLRAAIPSFVLIPVGYILYGWTTEYSIGVYAPIIGLFIYAFGQMSAFTPANVYLVDSQPGRSATAIGVNNCARSIAAAIMAIFSTQALHSVGPGILFTVLAAVNVLNILVIVMCMLFGQRWRRKFASKQIEQEKDGHKQNAHTHQEEGYHEAALEHSLARTASMHSTI